MTNAVQTNGTSGDVVDILLIGLGSIGSIYAWILEKTGKARVTAVARSNYKLYTETGVSLRTNFMGNVDNWRPYKVVKSQEEALASGTKYEICLLCTKYLPDVIPTEKLLAPAIASGQIGSYVLIQNGLGVEEALYQAVKAQGSPIISCAAWIGIMTSPSGDVVKWQSKDNLVCGLYPPLDPPSGPQNRVFSKREVAAVELWRNLVASGGGSIFVEDRIDSIRYSKNVWNCAWSTMEGLMRTTPHTLEDLDEQYTAPLKQFIHEIVEVGFKSGLLWEGMTQYPSGERGGSAEIVERFCWDRIYEMSCSKYHQGTAPHRMSLLIDLVMGRPFEVEAIVGEVLRIGQKHNINTPLLGYSYALLKGQQLETLRKQAGKGAVVD